MNATHQWKKKLFKKDNLVSYKMWLVTSLLRAILRESEAKLEMKNFNPPSIFVWR